MKRSAVVELVQFTLAVRPDMPEFMQASITPSVPCEPPTDATQDHELLRVTVMLAGRDAGPPSVSNSTVIVPLVIMGPAHEEVMVGPETDTPGPKKLHRGEPVGGTPVKLHETVPQKATVDGEHDMDGGGGVPVA